MLDRGNGSGAELRADLLSTGGFRRFEAREFSQRASRPALRPGFRSS
jgi:hypothetical protein